MILLFIILLVNTPAGPVDIAPAVLAFVSLAVTVISGFLRDDKQSVSLNALYAFLAILLISFFAFVMTNGFTANVNDTLLGVLGFMLYLIGHEAADLLGYIKLVGSPTAPAIAHPDSPAALSVAVSAAAAPTPVVIRPAEPETPPPPPVAGSL
jgi:hypothetical protein